jgi:ribosomal protein L35AE/L33A
LPPGGSYAATVNAGSLVTDWIAQFVPGSPSYPWIGQRKYVPLPRPAAMTMTAPGTSASYELRLLNGTTVISTCTIQVAAPSPALSINDVTVTEGNTGPVNAAFTVTLTPAASGTVTVNWATANGTATQPSDYLPGSGSLSFSPGEVTKTVTVVVNGDITAEPNETLFVNLSGASGASVSDAQGQATITSDDAPPAGLVCPTSPVPPGGSYATTVNAGSSVKDWLAQFVPGSPSYPWIGQRKYVPLPRPAAMTMTAPGTSGSFELRLLTGNTVIGSCTIQVAPASPVLSINDLTVTEGNTGPVNAAFTVTLTPAASGTVTVNWATANVTATQPSDYLQGSGSLSFSPGELTKTVTVVVNGDIAAEPNETFFVNLSGASGASVSDAQGQGTITSDDAPPAGLVCPTLPVPPRGSYTATVNAGSSLKDWLAHYTPGSPSYPWIGQRKYVPLPRPAAMTMTAPAAAGTYELRLLSGNTVIGSCTIQVAAAGSVRSIDDAKETTANAGTVTHSPVRGPRDGEAVLRFPAALAPAEVPPGRGHEDGECARLRDDDPSVTPATCPAASPAPPSSRR